jgi:hypothetical protein
MRATTSRSRLRPPAPSIPLSGFTPDARDCFARVVDAPRHLLGYGAVVGRGDVHRLDWRLLGAAAEQGRDQPENRTKNRTI